MEGKAAEIITFFLVQYTTHSGTVHKRRGLVTPSSFKMFHHINKKVLVSSKWTLKLPVCI